MRKSKKREIPAKRRLFTEPPNKKKSTTQKSQSRRTLRHSSSSSDSDTTEEEIQLIDSSDSEFNMNDDNDAECLFCTGLFSQDTHGEKWGKCIQCYRWAHEECGADEDPFICHLCRNK